MISPVWRDKIYRIVPAFMYLAATAAFIKNRFALLDFPLDDAWIHRVYARSIAFGHGFAYNPGQQEAGSSSPLWSLVTAPVHWLEGWSAHLPTLGVKAIGILLGLACVLIVQRIVSRLAGSSGIGAVAASLFAIEPKLLFSAFSGMETNFLVALLAGACLAWMETRSWLFIILIGLAPTARPEAILALPIALAGIASIWRTRRSVRATLAAGLLPVLPALAWASFCFHATGHWLPNTFYIKARPIAPNLAELQAGLVAVLQYGTVPGWLFVFGVGAFCFLCLKSGKRAVAPFLFLLALPMLYVAGVVFSRPFYLSGYYWTRWTDPGALLIAAACCAGCAFILALPLFRAETSPARSSLGNRVESCVLWLLFALFLVPTFATSFVERRNHLASDSRAIAIIDVRMGEWIRDHTPPDAVVGVIDAGAIRYFGRRRTLDLVGLNYAPVAFGKQSLVDAVSLCDWLAVFPVLLETRADLVPLRPEFDQRFETSIPFEEYTVCTASFQTRVVALERKQTAR